ncbi:nucleotidyltransferase family protein [Pengzhenrongella frigida]|uniref:Nucleotidyltransferase family protein n=1 Tax=Pengzhenrongella frigida TaxID=1259133 RepID=A0A4Q5MY79_9MICO|nr:nucleotidyltransferase family protein [Cellulomonas sp. HLT2-17]RYV50742.1 hypothetical protein EUA98_11860 [Cellulomonas sp. HLT2-17]
MADATGLRPLSRLLVDSALGRTLTEVGPELSGYAAADVLEASSLHRVAPAVARALASAAQVPAEWSRVLAPARHAQIARHMRAVADLRIIATALDAAGIGWVAIKGPVAAELIWPSVDMREYFDLDLLVDRGEFARAMSVLAEAGLRLLDRNWPLLERSRRAELTLLAPNGTPVDLHWDIAVAPRLRRGFRTDVPGMLARSRRVPLPQGFDVGVLDPEDTLVHLAFHAAQEGATRLMWLADLHYAAVGPTVDWDTIARRARAMRLEVPLGMILDRVQRTLGGSVGTSFRAVGPGPGAWGELARRTDARVRFPGLPGDPHLSGAVYRSARRSLPTSAAVLLRSQVEARRIEARERRRRSPGRPLRLDVPDAGARARYLQWVAGGAR